MSHPILAAARAAGLAILLSAGSALPAQLHLNGTPAAPSPDRAESGGFAVLQLASNDPQKFHADWDMPTAGANLTTTSSTPRNKPIVTFIVFRGCRADATGQCNVTVDFNVIGPDKSEYARQDRAPVWAGPAPNNQNFQLSQSELGLIIEDKDKLGPYVVRAAVTDHIAGITLRTEQVLTAEATK
jgi:hypothetical protein